VYDVHQAIVRSLGLQVPAAAAAAAAEGPPE